MIGFFCILCKKIINWNIPRCNLSTYETRHHSINTFSLLHLFLQLWLGVSGQSWLRRQGSPTQPWLFGEAISLTQPWLWFGSPTKPWLTSPSFVVPPGGEPPSCLSWCMLGHRPSAKVVGNDFQSGCWDRCDICRIWDGNPPVDYNYTEITEGAFPGSVLSGERVAGIF